MPGQDHRSSYDFSFPEGWQQVKTVQISASKQVAYDIMVDVSGEDPTVCHIDTSADEPMGIFTSQMKPGFRGFYIANPTPAQPPDFDVTFPLP